MLRPTLLILCTALALPAAAQGLRLKSDSDSAFRTRLHLLSTEIPGSSRLLGAQLMGDYYLNSQVQGLRLSGGLLIGPQSLVGVGLAPSGPSRFGVGQRRLLGNPGEPTLGQPYVGVGISRYGETWSITADLGLTYLGAANVRLGRSQAPTPLGIDETLSRLHWSATVQLGISYRF